MFERRPPQGRVPVTRFGGHASGAHRHRAAHTSPRAHAAARAGHQRGPRGRDARRPRAVARARRHQPRRALRRRCPAQQAEQHGAPRGPPAAGRAGRREPDRPRGSRWHTQCGGASDTGRAWYRVTSVNGKSVQKLYGRKAVYGAKSLFSVVYRPLEATGSGVRLRTDTEDDPAATLKAKLAAGARVIASRHRPRAASGPPTATAQFGHRAGTGIAAGIGDRGACPRCTASRRCDAARGLWRSIAIEVPPPPETSGFIEGVDVSHWQGTISWPDVAAAGKRFAFMKASGASEYVEPDVRRRTAPRPNANGLKVGAYHFAKPDSDVGRRHHRGRPLRRHRAMVERGTCCRCSTSR